MVVVDMAAEDMAVVDMAVVDMAAVGIPVLVVAAVRGVGLDSHPGPAGAVVGSMGCNLVAWVCTLGPADTYMQVQHLRGQEQAYQLG